MCRPTISAKTAIWLAACLGCCGLTGCYAPLRSPGIPAHSLPEEYRIPVRATSTELNYALLTGPAVPEFQLGANDVIRVEIADLVPRTTRLPGVDGAARNQANPFSQQVEQTVDSRGEILLPLVGTVRVAGLTMSQAGQRIREAYLSGFLDQTSVTVTLVRSQITRVVVLGAVARPDVYELPKYENDIAHAIARAGGLLPIGADEIQVHRRVHPGMANVIPVGSVPPGCGVQVLNIPLRSNPPVEIAPWEAVLQEGDVVVVRGRPDEVFFVVGRLNPNNMVRFSMGRENRDLGNGFVIPPDRDIDVVTAVAMAGYIDPIDSPTTVTVHRRGPDGQPHLILVDLIAARFNRCENIMVQPGDIIYLNPDASWWFRRTLDRVIPDLLVYPYQRSILKAFGQDQQ